MAVYNALEAKLSGKVAVKIGGSGGGRPDMAQAGGNDPSGIDAAFAELKTLLQR